MMKRRRQKSLAPLVPRKDTGPTTKFRCPWCPLETPWLDVGKIHLQYAHLNKMWLCQCTSPSKCLVCVTLCTQASQLKSKLNNEDKKQQQLTCRRCRTFKTTSSSLLNAHKVLCHTMECGLCNYFADTKSNLNAHIRTHYQRKKIGEEEEDTTEGEVFHGCFVDGQYLEVKQRRVTKTVDLSEDKSEGKSYKYKNVVEIQRELTDDSENDGVVFTKKIKVEQNKNNSKTLVEELEVFLCQMDDCSFATTDEKKLAVHYNDYHRRPIVDLERLMTD